jgi:hypothetical protein
MLLAHHAGRRFLEYIDVLQDAGYITTGLEAIVDRIRLRGNIANHDLPSSSEEEAAITASITQHLLVSIYELPRMPVPEAKTETETENESN